MQPGRQPWPSLPPNLFGAPLHRIHRGETYAWCACGLSRNQPFCDGSHKGSDVKPLTYTAGVSYKLVFCGRKISAWAPIYNGTHCAG